MAGPSTLKDYKLHLFLLKKWEQKTDPNQTVKIINAKFGDNFTTPTQVRDYYERFNNGDTQIFNNDSSFYISSGQSNTNIQKSLFFMTDDEHFNRNMLTKDGRFLIFPYFCHTSNQGFIVIYDSFRGIKKINPVPFKPYRLNSHSVDQFLFIADGPLGGNWCKFYVLKIDYDDLSAKEFLPAHYIPDRFRYAQQILIDQLDNTRFLICRPDNFLTGQISQENKQLIWSDVKNVEIHASWGKRFVGNKFQDFTYETDLKSSMKWCEIDMDTMEKKLTNVPINLDTEFFENFMHRFALVYYWTIDKFYAMFKLQNSQHSLLMFDSKTLKWSEVGFFASRPESMFIDGNEVITLQVKNFQKYSAYYRIGSRKPDTLMNLIRLTAVKELNLYGNKKYLNVVKKLEVLLNFD